jgi:diguanylate cyclase (GGDEF)-like protein
MLFRFKRIIYPLIVPAGLIIFSALVIWKWPYLTQKVSGVKEFKALLVILPILPYVVFSLGIIMGWRYDNTGMMLASLTLAVSYLALSRFGSGNMSEGVIGPSIPETVAFLLPLNLAIFTMLTKRRIFTSTGLSCVILVILQIFAVALLCHPGDSTYPQLVSKISNVSPLATKKLSDFLIKLRSILHDNSFFGYDNISTPAIFAYSCAFFLLIVRFLLKRDVILAGFLGALVATFLGIAAGGPEPSFMIYFSAAGIILIITSIEASFSMAYIDELTGLPGRRSLNQSLINLGKKYAIAMVDIDHFKKFNDTYGHGTGDQVLKMVASKLRGMSGGAKTFRYGGEEFTAIFSGKSAEEAIPYLEQYRKSIESSPFVVRSRMRRRSTLKNRGKSKLSGLKRVKVTVSIGVAEPDKDLTNPEKVLKAADKTLYKAKKAGRNQVKS